MKICVIIKKMVRERKDVLMVKVWLADITPLLEESVYRQYYQELPDWRRKKADRYCFAKGKAESAGVWSLWRRVRAQSGLGEDAVFNLSHSV